MSIDIKKMSADVQSVLNAFSEKIIDKVYFVACGGSSALMYPSKYFMDRESDRISSDLYSSNEFIYRNPKSLCEKSLVILCSFSGTTPETVAAAKHANSRGALTVGLTHDLSSPLANAVDFPVKFGWFPDLVAEDTNHAKMLQLVSGLLFVKEGNQKFNSFIDSLSVLEKVIVKAETQFQKKIKAFGQRYKDEEIIYTLASGANFGEAYAFTSCFLLEMQWIHSNAIHAGEYFHGPFEIVDENILFFVLLGIDETRLLDERALAFTKRYGGKIEVLDAQEYDLTGIAEEVKGYIAPIITDRLIRRYAESLAEARNHPLSTRRYMWKVEY